MRIILPATFILSLLNKYFSRINSLLHQYFVPDGIVKLRSSGDNKAI